MKKMLNFIAMVSIDNHYYHLCKSCSSYCKEISIIYEFVERKIRRCVVHDLLKRKT